MAPPKPTTNTPTPPSTTGTNTPPAVPVLLLNRFTVLHQKFPKVSIAVICFNLTFVVTRECQIKGAQLYIDLVDRAMDTTQHDLASFKRLLRVLRRSCGCLGKLPSSYVLSCEFDKTRNLPAARGGSADVWKGKHGDVSVAFKYLRISTQDEKKVVMKKFCKEAVTWKRLSHPNIVPFLGVTRTYPPSMVSEWMINGNVTVYVRSNQEVNRLNLLMDICKGLEFLHSFEIVHGDLKGANIFVDSNGRARLADFGVTSIISHLDTVNPSSIGSRPPGTYRWQAPEILDPTTADPSDIGPSTKSDMYALAMVIIELFTGNVPFPELKDTAMLCRIMAGKRPPRPEGGRGLGLSDSIWKVVEMCWQEERDKRPTIEFVLKRLRPGA